MATPGYDAGNDYYEILGIHQDASADEIKKAYKRLAAKWHPDINSEAGAEEQFKLIGLAFETLRDADSRYIYDQLREANTTPLPPVLKVDTKLVEFGVVSYGEVFPERAVLFDNEGGEGVFSTIPEEGSFWKVEGGDAGDEALGKFVFSLTIDEHTEPGNYAEYVQIQIDNDEGVSAIRVLITVEVDTPVVKPSARKLDDPMAWPPPSAGYPSTFAGSGGSPKKPMRKSLIAALILIPFFLIVANSGDDTPTSVAASTPSPPPVDMTVKPVTVTKRAIAPQVFAIKSSRIQRETPVYASPTTKSRLVSKLSPPSKVKILCTTYGEAVSKTYYSSQNGGGDRLHTFRFWFKIQNPAGYVSRLSLEASGAFTYNSPNFYDCATGARFIRATGNSTADGRTEVFASSSMASGVVAKIEKYDYGHISGRPEEYSYVLPLCKAVATDDSPGYINTLTFRLLEPAGWANEQELAIEPYKNEVPNC